MYRAVTLAALRSGVLIENEACVTEIAQSLYLDIQPSSVDDGRKFDVLMDGNDITWELRDSDVDENVSLVSTYLGVRQAMTLRQREIGLRGQVVMVGRDIGTVVLPEADLKIYLDASVDERAHRRHQESLELGRQDSFDEILRSMDERDQLDSTRELAPLLPATDAVILDSTELTIDQVFERILELALN
jgi:cytidylate kinase